MCWSYCLVPEDPFTKISNQFNQGALTKISFGDFCRPRPRHSVKTWKSWLNFLKSSSHPCPFTPARKKFQCLNIIFLVFIWCRKMLQQLKNMANSDIRSTESGWTYFTSVISHTSRPSKVFTVWPACEARALPIDLSGVSVLNLPQSTASTIMADDVKHFWQIR